MADNTIVIEPVTRIEGHAKITIQLDENGKVADAHFHVTQFRGFERISQGRMLHEMPSLMARICGICPVSHMVASAKACDEVLGVTVPPVGVLLRRVLNLAQIVQSHALSFFYLSSPDLLLGFESDPALRNLVGVAQQAPELALDGVALRRFGQRIIERLGGKRVHPAWVVPGGVSRPLDAEQRAAILEEIPDARARAHRSLEWFKANVATWADEAAHLGEFPSLHMGLVHETGNAAYSDGSLRIMLPDTFGTTQFLEGAPEWAADWTGQRVDSKDPYIAGDEYIAWLTARGRDPHDKLVIASDALDVDDILGLHAYFGGTLASGTIARDFRSATDFHDRKKWTPGRRIRFSAGWGTLLTNDFRGCDPSGSVGFDPISLISKVSTVEGRPAVKLSDNYAKALGPPEEIERYRRVFGTVGVANIPVIT